MVAPNQTETNTLIHELMDFDNEGIFYKIANLAFMAEPQLQDLLDYASYYYKHTELEDGPFTDDEIKNFQTGMSEGFSFMLGCLTYVQMSRSNQPISDMVDGVEDYVPHLDKETKRRFKRVITGVAPVEANWKADDPNFDSSQLPAVEMGDYLFDHPYLLELFAAEMCGYSDSLKAGFMTGAETMLTVYVQHTEEQIGALIKS